MSESKVVNYGKVKHCINAEARKVSRENLKGTKEENYFLRAWCLRKAEWCDMEFGVENCYFSTDDNVD